MFGPFKIVRKVFGQLKSDMTPPQLAVAASLGVLMGLTPAGLHWLPIIGLALLINCSMAAFLLSFGIFKGLFLAIAPLAFKVGTGLLAEPGPAQSFVAMLHEAPVFAFLGYNNYLVFGSYCLAIPAAVVLFFPFLLMVKHYRKTFIAKMNDSEKMQKLSKNFFFKVGRWFFAGKEKKEFAEKKKRFILLRPFRAYMAVFIPLLVVGLWLGTGLYVEFAIEDIAVGGINRAFEVQATFGDIEYSFFGQKLSFSQFQMPDPDNTMENLFQVGEFEGDIGFLDLLAGRVHIEKLALSDVRLHVRRDSDGKLNLTELPGAQPEEGETSEEEQKAWEEYATWLNEKGSEADWADLWKRYTEYREKAAEAREKEEAKPKPGPEPLPYDPELCWKPDRTRPFFAIDDLELSGFQVGIEDQAGQGLPSLTDLSGKALSLSTMPGWDGKKMEVDFAGKLDGGKSGGISLDFSKASPLNGELKIEAVPLDALRSLYEKQLPIDVKKGSVTLQLKGIIGSDKLELTAALAINGLQVARRPDQPELLGMDAETSGYIEMGLNYFGENGVPIEIELGVTGTPSAPEFHARAAFLEAAKRGLEEAGRKELQKYIDRIGGEVDAIKAQAQKDAEEIKAKALEQVSPLKEEAGKTLEAIKRGDVEGTKEQIDKTKEALDKVRDTDELKKDVKEKGEDLKESVEGLKGLFKKEDDDKKDEGEGEKKEEEKDPVKDALDLFGGSKKEEPAPDAEKKEEPKEEEKSDAENALDRALDLFGGSKKEEEK